MADDDPAAPGRIIKHMNKDHQDSLVRYLEHFCHIPSSTAKTARLEEITFEHMIITSTGRRNIVYFELPLQSWGESRERVVEMDQQAMEGLGKSDLIVTRYTRPRGFHLVVFVTCLAVYVCFATRRNFEPGALLYEGLLKPVPRFNAFCHAIQPYLIVFMHGIHATEAFFFERRKLAKHGVARFSRLWWTWMTSVYIEGAGAFLRVDALVKEQKELKASRKH